ncbi:MAG: hypothetical protein IKS69_03855, partial [Erysipelotrichaceae bacterium]|nr:hypothetical protein [Erysipelotrichaceae bacterium]
MNPFYVAALLSWSLLILFSTLYPYRLFNSIFLASGLFLTVIVFFDWLTTDFGQALLITFCVIFVMLLLTPFLLIINGITMLKREGRSIANLLSLLLVIGIEIGEFAFFI